MLYHYLDQHQKLICLVLSIGISQYEHLHVTFFCSALYWRESACCFLLQFSICCHCNVALPSVCSILVIMDIWVTYRFFLLCYGHFYFKKLYFLSKMSFLLLALLEYDLFHTVFCLELENCDVSLQTFEN